MPYSTRSDDADSPPRHRIGSVILMGLLVPLFALGVGCDPPLDPVPDIQLPRDASVLDAGTGDAADGTGDASSPDAGDVGDVADSGDAGPQEVGLCDPEPDAYPPRPKWSEFDKGHPDYRNVMNNFNALDSLRLLGSMVIKAVQGIQDFANAASSDETGYCICNCGSPDWSTMPSNPGDLASWASNQSTMFQNQCWADGKKRAQCVTQCQGQSDFGTVADVEGAPQQLWVPEDIFQKPDNSRKFALILMDWLGQILGLFTSSGNSCSGNNTSNCNDGEVCHNGSCKSELKKVLDTMSTVGAEITDTVQNIIDALDNIETFINRFTEGYHLGAYSQQRPDLHMCVGWAGHGAFAQMGNLGGDKVSIGARYTSHALSWKHRAQYRSGGFGVNAFGKSLSLLPTPELNAQIDARRVWNTKEPFGVDLPGGEIQTSQIEKYDIFSLVDDNEVQKLASADGDPNNITIGELLVEGYYPADYTSAQDGNTYTWPRSEADGPKPWLPWEGWDGEEDSTAVLSAGLNLPLAIKPIEKSLPTIPVFPPYASIQPYFSLGAGVEWIHQTDKMRDRIQTKVNENIPNSSDQLDSSDFQREMHAMQAPDVTGDDGTTAYVQPEVGADLMFGLQLSSFAHLGVTASIGVGSRVEPGGWGGVVDLNYALVQTLRNSNPPPDASCEAVYSVDETESCSNTSWDDSTGDYACTTDAQSSCCIDIGDTSVCVDDWTGIDEDFCTTLDQIGQADDKLAQAKDWVDELENRDFVDSATAQVLRGALSTDVMLSSQWNAGQTCSEASCGTNVTPVQMDSLSSCEKHGYCIGPDGDVLAHDVTEEFCQNGNSDGDVGRCCWNYTQGTGDTATYDDIACGVTQSTCEDRDGVYFPGGSCAGDVAASDCTNRVDERIGAGETTFVPYECTTELQPEVTDWQGAGCHPLNDGYPSACGCSSDDDCAAGETCNDDGLCESSSGYSCSCDPSNTGSCPSGRSCRDGACFKECSNDSDCPSPMVCDSDDLCTPEHEIPTAEEVVWGVQNGTAPLHAVSSYSFSEVLFWAYVTFGVEVGLSVDILGGTKELTLWEFSDLEDLGSTRKGWYQPGLEARYQHDCTAPAGQVVSNRQPEPQTTASGVNIPADNAFAGHVNRYPDPIPSNIDPDQDGNACHPSNDTNACTWEDFVGWCKNEMPNNVEDPDAPTNDDLTGGLDDTADWGEEIGLELWTSAQRCIDGEPWYEWAQNANGSLDNLQCLYDDGQTQTSFACQDSGRELLYAFGCLDTNLSSNAQDLAAEHGSTITQNGGAQFDLGQMLIDPSEPFEMNNVKVDYLFSPFGSGLAGYHWVEDVEQCYDSTYAEESKCECASDSDCDQQAGETCGPNGFCRHSGGAYAECPVVELAQEPDVESCCGNGTIENGEECDDGNNTPGDGCSSYCTVEEGRTGACCDDYQCVETTQEGCEKRGGSFDAGASCDEVDCSQSAATGACCDGEQCTDGVPATECGGDFTFYEDATCAEVDACGDVSSGACCEGNTCSDVAPHQCGSTEYWGGQSCADVECGPYPDVEVDKAVGADAIPVGEATTYQIRVSTQDTGPSYSGSLVVEDSVPGCLDVQSASIPEGSCNVTGQDVVCENPVSNGFAGPAVFTIEVVVEPQSGCAGQQITNCAELTSPDADPSNNQGCATSTITN